MKTETAPSSTHSIYRRIGAFAAAAVALSGAFLYVNSKENPAVARSEAHFSVACPTGGSPAIIEVAHSGALPIEPVGRRYASAVVRLVCPNEDETPVVVRDTQHGGACLGYGKESHLVIEARQPGEDEPEFFVTDQAEIGVIGDIDNLVVTKAQIHHHDLEDPFDQDEYQRNNCG